MRFVLLLLFIQFANPVLSQGNAGERVCEKTTYSNNHHDINVCLTVLRKDSEENDEVEHKSSTLSAELIDFAFLNTFFRQYHSHFDRDFGHASLAHEPLFKLNCNFLI